MTFLQFYALIGLPVAILIGGYFYARSARNIGRHKHQHPAE